MVPVKKQEPVLTVGQLIHGLRTVGLRAGQHILVHSRLSSFGYVKGGASAVIDALEKVITPEGTLVMPTYSGQLIYLLETLAIKSGINGPNGSGRGVVFEGIAGKLWEELKPISKEAGIAYPFGSPADLCERLKGERMGILASNGWVFELTGSKLNDSANLRVVRDAPPLPSSEIKPWRMPVWTGVIPDTFWQRPETLRSHQYSGSFTAWGRLAERILEGHDNRPDQKLEDHPLYRMKEARGKILLLGVGHRSSSTIHVAQWTAFRDSWVKLPQSWKEFLEDFQTVDEPLDRAGGQIKGRTGKADVRLMDTQTLFEVVAELLREKTSKELDEKDEFSF